MSITTAPNAVSSASLVYAPSRCLPPAIKSENRNALSSRDTMMKKGFRGLPKRRICDLNTSISMSGAASMTDPNFEMGGLFAEILKSLHGHPVTHGVSEDVHLLGVTRE